jgi:hypothetical protein
MARDATGWTTGGQPALPLLDDRRSGIPAAAAPDAARGRLHKRSLHVGLPLDADRSGSAVPFLLSDPRGHRRTLTRRADADRNVLSWRSLLGIGVLRVKPLDDPAGHGGQNHSRLASNRVAGSAGAWGASVER